MHRNSFLILDHLVSAVELPSPAADDGWGAPTLPGSYKWLTARWMPKAGAQYPRPADGVQARQTRPRHTPPRVPFHPG
jgi:hypothetical protein